MIDLSKWEVLCSHLGKGSLWLIDLVFAKSVLKRCGSEKQEHAALLAVLFALSRQGHLTLDISEQGLLYALKLLKIEDAEPLFKLLCLGAETFPCQAINTWICRSGSFFYLQKNWTDESEILLHLMRLKSEPPAIALSSWSFDPRLNQAQKNAVETGIRNSLSLLTGGPGTGKTFTAIELVKACLFSVALQEQSQFRIILTAPTGKAVAQLEASLRSAIANKAHVHSGTLHSILGIKFGVHDDPLQPLFADLIIVDECSMIDVKIFCRLLASISSGTRLVLIGDKDQLPPVEAGSVFADLIDAGVFPSTQLNASLRSDRKEILLLAKLVREGKEKEALSYLRGNLEIEWTDLQEGKKSLDQLYAHLWEQCKDRFACSFLEKPTAQHLLNSLGKFSILSCMRQGPLGVDAVNGYFLNQYIQTISHGTWWVAPLMITRNDPELQLFNGDLGFVVRKVGPGFSLRQFHLEDYALFPESANGFKQISALALNAFEYSYCLSVHKSQGSEYDETFILVPEGSELFGREVLYTAITRARHKVCLAGSQLTLSRLISLSSRKTSGISYRLK